MRHLPPDSPLPGHLRRLLLSDAPADRQLFRRLFEVGQSVLTALAQAGQARPGADPAVRAAFLAASMPPPPLRRRAAHHDRRLEGGALGDTFFCGYLALGLAWAAAFAVVGLLIFRLRTRTRRHPHCPTPGRSGEGGERLDHRLADRRVTGEPVAAGGPASRIEGCRGAGGAHGLCRVLRRTARRS
ncbi:hypothetical protein RKD29_007529 [Streptomyces tendae]|uniref:hypothetical protein n=1 Tax=Streptomyces tendae TaxID=1932 RepID=UPI0038334976